MATTQQLTSRAMNRSKEEFERWIGYLRQIGTLQARATLEAHAAHPGLLEGAFVAGFVAGSAAAKR